MIHSKLFMCLLVFVLTFSFISCSNDVKTQALNSSTSSKALFEMEKLTSEDELNALVTRGDDDIVDWQLSMEFAQLWLESGIEAGDYPVDSELWEIPIAVYDAEGEIQYYEFRVVSGTEVVAAITGAARKSYGCPILYEFLTDGYADELTEMYNKGIFTEETLPRVVDNGYPTVVFGTTTITRGTDDGFDGFLNPETGDKVNEEDIATPLTYDEAKEICPDMLPEYIDDAKMQALIEDFKKNGEEFWKLAVANKGHIADFAVRGGSKSKPERTAITSGRLTKYRDYVNDKRKEWNGYTYRTEKGSHYFSVLEDEDKIINYGAACASVATGFVLDFIHANCMSLPEWDSLSYEKRHDALYDLLNVWPVYLFGTWEGDAAWPWNLKNPIEHYTSNRYSVSGSGIYCYPKTAINNNMPGISLRTWKISNNSFGHYRPVIAFEKHGWLCFSWYEFKVLDRVDCSDNINGSWETYIPLYHLGSYDVW